MAWPIRHEQEAYLTANETSVFEMRATGEPWRMIAATFFTSCHVLNKWLKASDSPARWPAWKALDEIAAESRVSDAREILDTAQGLAAHGVSSPELTRLAIARSDLAKWEAGVMARARFGTTPANGGLTINVGTMHLTAVKQLAVSPPPPPAGLIADGEYEVCPSLEEMLGA